MSTIKSSAENLTLNADGANNDIKFQSNGSEVASIDQAGLVTAASLNTTGSVGIGTTSPDKKLDVSHTGNVYAKVQSTNSTAAGINLKTNGGSVEDWLMQADEGANGVAWYNTAYRMTLGNTGDLNINTGDLFFGTAGKGIVLGATSNTAANTLDDYEEGTFTPTVANGTIGAASGAYTKIGNVCTLTFTLKDFNDKSTDAYITIRSLPFTQDGTANVGTVLAYQPGQSNPLNLIRGADGNEFHMYYMINASSWTVQKHNTLGSDPHFYCVATYKTT